MRRPKYLQWIRTLPCVICGDDVTTEAAHLRLAIRTLNKPNAGMGAKPDDWWTLPLCHGHHAQQHKDGEAVFWNRFLMDPGLMCLALWQVQFDTQAACDMIRIWNGE